jgi:hypothetical protein
VQLFAASRAILEPNLIPAKVRFHEVTLDALRGLLSGEEFDTLQAQGQQMSLEEAIAFSQEM